MYVAWAFLVLGWINVGIGFAVPEIAFLATIFGQGWLVLALVVAGVEHV